MSCGRMTSARFSVMRANFSSLFMVSMVFAMLDGVDQRQRIGGVVRWVGISECHRVAIQPPPPPATRDPVTHVHWPTAGVPGASPPNLFAFLPDPAIT